MTATNVRVQMQQRRDTAANWTSTNPTLLNGELGYETDTKKVKIGNGTAVWSALAYVPGFAISAYPLATADIADSAITAAKIADDAVTAAKIANTSVTAGSYTTANITVDAQGRVTSAASGASAPPDGSVTTAKLANDAVTGDKLANDITIANNLTVTNDLTVNGTTTTIDSTTLVVEDKNIEIGKVSTPSDTTADGGGITLKGATDKTLTWVDSTDCWTFNQGLNLTAGTAGAPALVFNGDVNSGLFQPGADSLAIATGGTQRITVDSSGNVGIATSTTVGKMTVKIDTNKHISFNGAQGEVGSVPALVAHQDNGSLQSMGMRGVDLRFATGSAERLRIDSSGNIGIGLTSPQTRFHSSGTTNGAQATFGITSSGLKISTFQKTGNDAGVILDAQESTNGTLAFNTRGAERMRLDSSGNIGIGTTGADTKLQIENGSISVGSSTNTNATNTLIAGYGYILSGTKFGNTSIRSTYSNSNNSGTLEFYTASSGTNTAERMKIDGSGQIKIPAGSFDLRVGDDIDSNAGTQTISVGSVSSGAGGLQCFANPTNGQSFLQFGDGSASSSQFRGYVGYKHADDALVFGTAATERLRIDSSGRLGLGTTSPSQILELKTAEPRVCLNATNAAAELGIEFEAGGSRQGHVFHNHTSGEFSLSCGENTAGSHFMTFNTGNGAERMRIDSSGRVGIGTTLPDAKLGIGGDNADIKLGGSQYFRLKATSGGDFTINDNDLNERLKIGSNGRLVISNSVYQYFNSNSTTTSSITFKKSSSGADGVDYIQCRNTANFAKMVVGGNGNIVNVNNSYGSLSDIRLKENIVDANSQWDDLKALQVRNYNFIEGETHTQLGLIAQEVELVSPGLVNESNDLGTITKSVNYSVLYMKAVKALQEAMTRIETLEKRLSDAGIA